MLYKATQLIAQKLDEAEVKYITEETSKVSYVQVTFSKEQCDVTVRFISADDDNDVKLLTDAIAKTPENKREGMYKCLNELNNQYRVVKFTMDSRDGEITGEYDFPLRITDECVGEVAMEMLVRTVRIVAEAYPVIMGYIYGGH